jgi:hypothetical protein
VETKYQILAVIFGLGTLLASVCSVIKADNANKMANDANTRANEANQIANEANQIAYQYYMPSIKPMQVLQYDDKIGNQSGEIQIYNEGGRIENFNVIPYIIVDISYSNYEKHSYIIVTGYYEYPGEMTPNSVDLLWRGRILKGYAYWDRVRSEFNSAGYNMGFTL